MSKRVIGLDFGTSTTLVATREGTDPPQVIPIGNTTSWMPSVVGLSDGKAIVGEEALALPPEQRLHSVKALITAGERSCKVNGEEAHVEDLVAAVISEAVTRAKSIIGLDVFTGSRVVLGCPVLWTGVEREVLASAAHRAGIDVDVADIIDEPVAAALSWVHGRWMAGGSRPNGRSLVFDAGGGTLDVAYIDITGDATPDFTVLSAEAVAESGDALDEALCAYLLAQISDLTGDDRALGQRLLRHVATELKEALSFSKAEERPLGGGMTSVLSLKRAELEQVFDPQLTRALRLVRSVVRGGDLRLTDESESDTNTGGWARISTQAIRKKPWESYSAEVRNVALAGGLSQVPIVGAALSKEFAQATMDLVRSPQEAVVTGLAQGDRIDRLNLPRPPVNFVVAYSHPAGGTLDPRFQEWAKRSRFAYRAFSPLYRWDQAVRGDDLLGYEYRFERETLGIPWEVWTSLPKELEVRISCETPGATPRGLAFTVDLPNRKPSRIKELLVRHTPHDPFVLKLYTNGQMIVRGGGRELMAKITSWPRIRGPRAQQDKVVNLRALAGAPWFNQTPPNEE